MNTFPFLANVADAVGAPATSWDVPGIIFLKLLAVVFLVLLNGFFVTSEFAIVKVRASQLDALAAPSNGRARLARHVTSHLDSYLSATQLGITLASLGLGLLGEPFLADMIEPFFALAGVHSAVLIPTVSFALALTTITVMHIVLGRTRAEIHRYPQGGTDDSVDQPAAEALLSGLQAGHMAAQWACQLAP